MGVTQCEYPHIIKLTVEYRAALSDQHSFQDRQPAHVPVPGDDGGVLYQFFSSDVLVVYFFGVFSRWVSV